MRRTTPFRYTGLMVRMALITDAVLLTVSAAIEVATSSITVIPVVMTAARHTGGTVARTTVVSTIPTVMHTYVMVIVMGTIVVAVAVIVAVTAMTVPGMTSAIGHIEVRISEVEIVTVRVAEIDAEVPVACLPVEWAVEIGGCHKGVPLPVEEYIAEI